jgi:acylpyruvate hydrolase
MKLMRYNATHEPITLARLGVLLGDGLVGDMRAGYALYLSARGDTQAREVARLRMPDHIAAFLAVGIASWEAAKETYRYLSDLCMQDVASRGLDGERLFAPLDECRLHATVKPAKVIAVGRNYADHVKEADVKIDIKVPSAWIKATSTIVGPTGDIVKPGCTSELDYETELAVVIGKRCKDVPQSKAYDVIAGYTIMNDISARDIVRVERKEGNQLLGKMFDGFAPLGPWLVTSDEIVDPQRLELKTRVNGEIRQHGNTRDMIWSIPQLVAYVSQMTLEPGDVISTGTPSGVAMGRRPDEPSWFLQVGDILESEIEGLGCMRNKIVSEPTKQPSWRW